MVSIAFERHVERSRDISLGAVNDYFSTRDVSAALDVTFSVD